MLEQLTAARFERTAQGGHHARGVDLVIIRTSNAGNDRRPQRRLQTAHLGAGWGVQEIDVTDPLVLLGQPGDLLLGPGVADVRLAIEALQDLAIPRGQLAVVVVPRLVEQALDLLRAHVLDLLDADERGVAALALDLLREPLEVLVPLRRVGQKVCGALQRHGAQRPQPPPDAHAQARRRRRHTHQEQEQWLIHVAP